MRCFMFYVTAHVTTLFWATGQDVRGSPQRKNVFAFHSPNTIAETALPSTQALSAYSREENIGEEVILRVFMGRYRSDCDV